MRTDPLRWYSRAEQRSILKYNRVNSAIIMGAKRGILRFVLFIFEYGEIIMIMHYEKWILLCKKYMAQFPGTYKNRWNSSRGRVIFSRTVPGDI